jgi:putative oxidoreductase
MNLVRRAARLLVSWIFVHSGMDVLRKPQGRAEMAAPTLQKLREKAPVLPEDDVTLVRVNAGVQVVAGALFALGKAPRLAALALAGSLVPATVAGHPVWTSDDPARRVQQRTPFETNLAILGGLLLAATEARARGGLIRRP